MGRGGANELLIPFKQSSSIRDGLVVEVVDLCGARTPTTPTMHDGEDETSGEGMAGDNGDGGHQEGDECRQDLEEGIGHMAELAVASGTVVTEMDGRE